MLWSAAKIAWKISFLRRCDVDVGWWLNSEKPWRIWDGIYDIWLVVSNHGILCSISYIGDVILIILPNLTNSIIFQDGWNHQPVINGIYYIRIYIIWKNPWIIWDVLEKKPLINMMFRFVVVECGVALKKHVLMGKNCDFYYQHLRFQYGPTCRCITWQNGADYSSTSWGAPGVSPVLLFVTNRGIPPRYVHGKMSTVYMLTIRNA